MGEDEEGEVSSARLGGGEFGGGTHEGVDGYGAGGEFAVAFLEGVVKVRVEFLEDVGGFEGGGDDVFGEDGFVVQDAGVDHR